MLNDPQSLNSGAGGTSVSFARTNIAPGLTTYTSSDGTQVLTIRQSATKARFRREMRITESKISADALSPSINTPKSFSVYLVIDEPIVGFTDTELNVAIAALTEFVNDHRDAVLQGQS